MSEENVSEEAYQRISSMISSEDSVVGIDAKKTHIIIIDKLIKLEEKISEIEKRLDDIDG